MSQKQNDKQAYNVLDDYLNNLQEPPKTFEKGEIVQGKIIRKGDKEMLVDIGGRTEGVVSSKEMKLDGEKLNKKEGDEVLVYVVNPENYKGQIELSVRRTGTARKWHELRESRDNGTPITVKVVEANTGGVLVSIPGGLRGFVPSSQLANHRVFPSSGTYANKEDATKELQSRLADLIDEELEVVVMEIDQEKGRVILSEKHVGSEEEMQQRQQTLEEIGEGSVLDGEITGVAPFGLFVTAGGLEGLVHLSEISWDKVANPADFYQPGDKVKVQVIGIEDGGKRIAYSIKRLLPDPWDDIVKRYEVGQVIEGEVTKVVDYGAFVRVEEGLNGLVHISELSNNLVKDPSEVVSEGDAVNVKIISMSRDDRHLGLSIKKLGETEDKQKKQEQAQSGSEDKKVAYTGSPELARLSEFLDDDNEAAEETSSQEEDAK